MPQLDQATFVLESCWTISVFLFLYYVNLYSVVPNVYRFLMVRRFLMNHLVESLNRNKFRFSVFMNWVEIVISLFSPRVVYLRRVDSVLSKLSWLANDIANMSNLYQVRFIGKFVWPLIGFGLVLS